MVAFSTSIFTSFPLQSHGVGLVGQSTSRPQISLWHPLSLRICRVNVRNGNESGSKTNQIISRPKTLRIGSPVLLVSEQIMDYKWAKTCSTNNIISLVLTVTVTFWVANGNEYDVAMARLSSTTTAIFALLNCCLLSVFQTPLPLTSVASKNSPSTRQLNGPLLEREKNNKIKTGTSCLCRYMQCTTYFNKRLY